MQHGIDHPIKDGMRSLTLSVSSFETALIEAVVARLPCSFKPTWLPQRPWKWVLVELGWDSSFLDMSARRFKGSTRIPSSCRCRMQMVLNSRRFFMRTQTTAYWNWRSSVGMVPS